MKPGLYRLGFGPGFTFTIRIKDKSPNEAKIVKVEEASDTVKDKFINQVIMVDSIWIGHPPIFKSKGAKPLAIQHSIESKALVSASTPT